MSDQQFQQALNLFKEMDDETATEVAQTFLLGYLNTNDIERLKQNWRASFENENDFMDADNMLQSIVKINERSKLFRIAVETTVKSRPETKENFIKSVEDAGEKLFILGGGEIIALGVVASLIMREYYTRGKPNEKTIEEYNDKGGLIKRTTEKYKDDTLFSRFLGKIRWEDNKNNDGDNANKDNNNNNSN